LKVGPDGLSQSSTSRACAASSRLPAAKPFDTSAPARRSGTPVPSVADTRPAHGELGATLRVVTAMTPPKASDP
jgi:hypothetical protein